MTLQFTSGDQWLLDHRDGVDRDIALAWFDAFRPQPVEEMVGRWRGSGLPTGSPLDGLLESYGWWGKEFLDAETVHPLLFRTRSGPRPVDPALIPVGVLRGLPGLAHSRAARLAFTAVRPLLTTSRPKARLRAVEHRGVVTAAMVYDRLPIIDVFRRVNGRTVLGMMDLRGLPDPFFFILHRDGPVGRPARRRRLDGPAGGGQPGVRRVDEWRPRWLGGLLATCERPVS
ncbi:GXWXG protein [Blastococcus sp. DSM 46786]|uniref:DUF4334 domain-containing protein n=1 Tax=Blastococcus sp. DSM 46786 TaxID=1798227 RepID=UPI0008C6C08E|nr:DUF4334 domain-containing protein [Blastococcus sp. DSM 46786]SEL00695.1 GXWXG protein [Blastococcus sp. DSM 46786]